MILIIQNLLLKEQQRIEERTNVQNLLRKIRSKLGFSKLPNQNPDLINLLYHLLKEAPQKTLKTVTAKAKARVRARAIAVTNRCRLCKKDLTKRARQAWVW